MFNKITLPDGSVEYRAEGLGEYSLKDTLECGQCFRYERIEAGRRFADEYLFTYGRTVIRVGQDKPGELTVRLVGEELSIEELDSLFMLGSSLEEIREDILSRTDSEWLRAAAGMAGGIAILKQDPWETLISFIISQNNNIPRIRKIIKQIAIEYGVNISLLGEGERLCPLDPANGTPCEEICKRCGVCYSFPSSYDILSRPEGLLPSKPGFRYGYILDAAERVYSGEVDLGAISAAASYEKTLEALKVIKGVGDKVASCVALFGFANLEAFPIDVWMKRAIDEYFDGSLDPTTLGKYAGVAQQYIFHYVRSLSEVK